MDNGFREGERLTTLDDVVKEIKQLSEDFKKRNGNSSLRIPNKDMNLWMINWMIKQDGRITSIESKQKAFVLLITLLAACITIFKIL